MSAIILNGTSSSGKTSIAKAIQSLATEPFVHLQVDSFLQMFSWEFISNDFTKQKCMKAAVLGFHRNIASFLEGDFPLIIDHVIFGDLIYDDLVLNLDSHKTLFVGVHCSIDTLKAREVARKNRTVGIAESQFPVVHVNRRYDIEVDTDTSDSINCASKILSAYYQKVEQGS